MSLGYAKQLNRLDAEIKNLKAQRDELLEALEEIEWSNNEQWRTERAPIAIAKAKGE